MRLIATTALAALLACPAYADIGAFSWRLYCSPEWSDFEEEFGELQRGKSAENHTGVGFFMGRNAEWDILFFALGDGNICAAWVNEKPQGEPT